MARHAEPSSSRASPLAPQATSLPQATSSPQAVKITLDARRLAVHGGSRPQELRAPRATGKSRKGHSAPLFTSF